MHYARHTEEILAALSQGYGLTLNRLDQALLDLHVSVIMCGGQGFDPQRMTAIEIEETEHRAGRNGSRNLSERL